MVQGGRRVISSEGRPLIRLAFLVGLIALLAALLVQPGEMGSIDTDRRLQTTHSFWTSAPPVADGDYPDFGLVGRDGRIFSWYGLGQSLVMLPADIFATKIARDDLRKVVVSYIVSPVIAVLGVLACFHLLMALQFSARQAAAGALSLLFATTFLHYSQNMMENNLLLLLTMTGVYFQLKWLRTGSLRALLAGSVAIGANLITRLTTSLDLIFVALFLLLTLWLEPKLVKARIIQYCSVALPCYVFFFFIDRLYNFYRFESWTNTWIALYRDQMMPRNPSLPPGFPFSTPFRQGFLGPFLTPEKSIFLFDPLLIFTVVLSLVLWRRFAPEIKAWIVSMAALLLGYVIFYAKWFIWSGDFAWGDRFLSTPVQLLAMISLPLLIRHRRDLSPVVWKAGWALAGLSVAVQIASVFFRAPLEIYQMKTLGHPTFVIGLRFTNIAAWMFDRADDWGLVNEYTLRNGADLYSATPYFWPFLVNHAGPAPALIYLWFVVLAALLWTSFHTWRTFLKE